VRIDFTTFNLKRKKPMKRWIALLMVLLAFGTAIQAQASCPSGLSGADCEAFNSALGALTSADGFTAAFTYSETSSQAGSVTSQITAQGTLRVELDGDGGISALELLVPTATAGGSAAAGQSAGAGALIYVDQMLYVGTGEAGSGADDLTWLSLPNLTEWIRFNATLPSVTSEDGTTVPGTWLRTGDDPAAFAATATGGMTYDQMFSQITGGPAGLMLGGMDFGGMMADAGMSPTGGAGSLNQSAVLTLNPDGTPASLVVSANSSFTATDLATAFLGSLAQGMDLSSMMGADGDTAFGLESVLSVTFTALDSGGPINAPSESTALGEAVAGAVRSAVGQSLERFASAVFQSVAFEGAISALGNFDLGSVTSITGEATVVPQGAIEPGQSIDNTLETGSNHHYTFAAGASLNVTITLTSTEFDPFLELLGPNGEMVASNDDFEGLNSQIGPITLGDAGEYTIVVRSFGNFGAGAYTLTLNNAVGGSSQSQPTSVPAVSETPITVGGTLSGSRVADVDNLFTFEGAAGDVVTITMTSEDFDSLIRLLDPSGEEIASDDDSAGNLNARLADFELPADGIYTIVASSFGGFSSGDFEVTLESAAPVPPSTSGGKATAIAPGDTASGTRVAEVDNSFTFEGAAGDVVTITMTSDDFDSFVRLLDPSGDEISSDDDSAGNLNALLADFELPADGTYTIVASSFSSTSAGAFELTLEVAGAAQSADTGPSGSTLTYGDTVSGTRTSGEDDEFTFEGAAGDVVTITMTSEDFDAFVSLLDPDGLNLVSDDDSAGNLNAEISEFELSADGVYTIVASSFLGSAEGDFELTLSAEGASSGTLSASGEIRQWAASAEASSQYGDDNWSASQATGEPDTLECGDYYTAWASELATERATLTVTFEQPVLATEVNVVQTFNPGSIVLVTLITEDGGEIDVPSSTDEPGNTPCPGTFTLDVTGVSEEPVISVRIEVDQKALASWNEIDAVELVGTLP
jgi:hypothetical protein